MAEYKLFEGDVPHVSTFEFHEHRERAPHLEQSGHQNRLHTAARFVDQAAIKDQANVSVSDLGCGDGGLLSVIQQSPFVSRCWGYDFAPANEAGWAERGVVAYAKDAFGTDAHAVEYGRVTVMTEVLEHLAKPHEIVRRVSYQSNYLIASSPYLETPERHDECHAWAWDKDGYKTMIELGGWRIIEHELVDGMFQVVLAARSIV